MYLYIFRPINQQPQCYHQYIAFSIHLAMTLANGLIGTGFASQYRLQHSRFLKGPVGRCKAYTPSSLSLSLTSNRVTTNLLDFTNNLNVRVVINIWPCSLFHALTCYFQVTGCGGCAGNPCTICWWNPPVYSLTQEKTTTGHSTGGTNGQQG